jgi:hypothetical protein
MRKSIAVFFLVLASAGAVVAQDPGWRCQVTKPGGTLVYYQPQVEHWSNFQSLDWRMAISLTPAGSVLNLVVADYAQPGDRMTLEFNPAIKKIISLSVNTYMGHAKDAVTLQVQMAVLPDGTSYAQQTILNATSKQLVVTTTNSNYQKLGG